MALSAGKQDEGNFVKPAAYIPRSVQSLISFKKLSSRILGVRGRLIDLCKPTQRKYENAISVILGRNIDAVVVDEERTAIDCIEVRLPLLFHSALPGRPICYVMF